MHTFQVGKVVFMASRYDAETRVRAVRLVRDHVGDYDSEFAAIRAVAGRLGMSTEALRRWVRQADVDAGQAPGVTSESVKEIRELKRKNAELEQTIEILKAATSSSCGSATRHAVDLPIHHRTPDQVRGRTICRALTAHGCQIAPRTYWAWAKRAPSKRALSDLVITEVIAGLYEPDEHGRRKPERCTGR
jgi:transposase